jgi:hypothetical protein
MSGGPTTSTQNQLGQTSGTSSQNTTGTQNQQTAGTTAGTQNLAQTGTQTGTNIQGVQAPDWAQGLLSQISGMTGGMLGGQPAVNPIQQQGFTGAAGYANAQAPILSQATNWLTPYASGANVNAGSPAFREMQQREAGNLADVIDRQWSAGGRYGSAGHGGAVGSAVGDYLQRSGMAERNRQEQQQLQAIQQMPGAFAAGLLPFQTLQQTGAAAQAAPWANINQAAGILSGLNPAQFATRFGQTTGETTGTQTGATTGTTAGTTSGTTAGTQTGSQTGLNLGQNIGVTQPPATNWLGIAASALPALLPFI